jgi:hypothetical protein
MQKLKNRRAEPPGRSVMVGGKGGGERVKEGEYGAILCIHVCKWRNETC